MRKRDIAETQPSTEHLTFIDLAPRFRMSFSDVVDNFIRNWDKDTFDGHAELINIIGKVFSNCWMTAISVPFDFYGFL